MILVALDLANETGIAIGEPGCAPVCRTEDLGGGRYRGAALLRVVHGLIREFSPVEVVVEAPIVHTGPRTPPKTLRALVGLAEVAGAATRYLRTDFAEVPVATVRKHFLGMNPKGRDEAKALVMGRCRALGWKVRNDNEADAAALLDCRLAQLSPAHAVAAGPIFRGA